MFAIAFKKKNVLRYKTFSCLLKQKVSELWRVVGSGPQKLKSGWLLLAIEDLMAHNRT